MRKESDKLVIEPTPRKQSLIELLDSLEPINEEIGEIPDYPAEPVDLGN
jgi:antitoxin VapB